MKEKSDKIIFMDEKRREKYLQTRYKRELERYLNRVVNYAQQESFTKEGYETWIDKVTEKLLQAEKVPLYNDYYEKLEAFIEKTHRMKESDLESDEIQAEILHDANQIRKEKRKKRYNRKDRKRAFEDEF
jgi:glutaredoxin 2